MSRIRRYTRDSLELLVRDSLSYSEVIRKLGKSPQGSTQSLIVHRIREYGLDTSHFLGQGRNCGINHVGGLKKKPWSEILVLRTENIRERAFRLRRALIESGREYRCENPQCGVKGEWLGKLIILHVDHISGDWKDCRPENVRFMCPNCHNQVDGHSNRKGCTSITSTAEGARRRRKTNVAVPELA